MSQFYEDSIFWIDVDKIKPNPFQPRKEFDPVQLQALSDSIRQYGVLQALVVTRKEVTKADGGLATEYELIAGERRLRASKLAGIREVPCLIKTGEDNDLMKLELAIIENVQREDLNPVDRARAFQRLVDEFGFKHITIGEKVGKSREYVSNSLRLLTLPADILEALSVGKISEGHARPLMMLHDRPEEQSTLFKEILFKKLTVREAELIARKIAVEKVRKKEFNDPEVDDIEKRLADSLGTRVHIEKREVGGKIHIDFFSKDDLKMILDLLNRTKAEIPDKKEIHDTAVAITQATPVDVSIDMDDRTPIEKKEDENTEELYSVSNFSI
jgi:ParB family chromosome partitioning protein